MGNYDKTMLSILQMDLRSIRVDASAFGNETQSQWINNAADLLTYEFVLDADRAKQEINVYASACNGVVRRSIEGPQQSADQTKAEAHAAFAADIAQAVAYRTQCEERVLRLFRESRKAAS